MSTLITGSWSDEGNWIQSQPGLLHNGNFGDWEGYGGSNTTAIYLTPSGNTVLEKFRIYARPGFPSQANGIDVYGYNGSSWVFILTTSGVAANPTPTDFTTGDATAYQAFKAVFHQDNTAAEIEFYKPNSVTGTLTNGTVTPAGTGVVGAYSGTVVLSGESLSIGSSSTGGTINARSFGSGLYTLGLSGVILLTDSPTLIDVGTNNASTTLTLSDGSTETLASAGTITIASPHTSPAIGSITLNGNYYNGTGTLSAASGTVTPNTFTNSGTFTVAGAVGNHAISAAESPTLTIVGATVTLTDVPSIVTTGTIPTSSTAVMVVNPGGSAITAVHIGSITLTGNFTNVSMSIASATYGTATDSALVTLTLTGGTVLTGLSSLTLASATGAIVNAYGNSVAVGTISLTDSITGTTNVDSWLSVIANSSTSYNVTWSDVATPWQALLSFDFDPNIPLHDTVPIEVKSGTTLIGTKNWVFEVSTNTITGVVLKNTSYEKNIMLTNVASSGTEMSSDLTGYKLAEIQYSISCAPHEYISINTGSNDLIHLQNNGNLVTSEDCGVFTVVASNSGIPYTIVLNFVKTN